MEQNMKITKTLKTKKMKNDIEQVGGKHYQDKIKPWDIMAKYNMNWFQGEVLKYLCRFRRKDTPKMNLEKAISVCQKAEKEGIRGVKKTLFEDLGFILQYVNDYTLIEPGDMLPILNTICNMILRGEWAAIVKEIEKLLDSFAYGAKE